MRLFSQETLNRPEVAWNTEWSSGQFPIQNKSWDGQLTKNSIHMMNSTEK